MAISWHASDTDPPPAIPGVVCVPAHACNAIERRLGVPYPLWSPKALRQLASAARAADALHIHDCLDLPKKRGCLRRGAASRPADSGHPACRHGALSQSYPARAAVRGVPRARSRSAGGATQVAFVSEAVRRYFEAFVRFKAPPALVPNGVDHTMFHPVDEARRDVLRAGFGAGRGTPLLLFVGRFVEKKGLLVLRELAARFPRRAGYLPDGARSTRGGGRSRT